jgi:hypothetical protein
MKKLLIVIAMIFCGVICAFGLDTEETGSTDNQPECTGGWNEIDVLELDETVKDYVSGYLDGFIPHAYSYWSYKVRGWIIDHIWEQLVQGRRYLIAYYVIPEITVNEYGAIEPILLGLIILRRTPDGIISLEKEYSSLTLLDFIELMLTGEIREKEFPRASIGGFF